MYNWFYWKHVPVNVQLSKEKKKSATVNWNYETTAIKKNILPVNFLQFLLTIKYFISIKKENIMRLQLHGIHVVYIELYNKY